ncbi:hypothetical protein [Salinimonas iocasae]|uniref:Uncharacterized protein n=1 Tax=Salinimonas iocasae TaxID=2572577 RepID=A0A5B7YGA6_9ALTE|nr:hypothetical protein [Salinimonas iocasae]QCZ94376.1 hypothetical protein FBQ74_13260 [Salinimonas iocasae]
MKMSHHAKLRLAQRSLNEQELTVLAGIGQVVEQHGGTSLTTVPKNEKLKWVRAAKEALRLLNTLPEIDTKKRKRIRKVLNRIIERLSAKNQPYFISSNEEDIVITCGYYTVRRLRRDY